MKEREVNPVTFRGLSFQETIHRPYSPSSDCGAVHWEPTERGDFVPLTAHFKLSDPEGEAWARTRIQNTILYCLPKDTDRG